MKSSPTAIAVGVLTIVLAGAGYAYWYSIILSEGRSLSSALISTGGVAEGARVAKLSAVVATSDAIVSEYAVSEQTTPAFISDLETRGRERGATVETVSVSKNTSGPVPVLVLALSIKGGFDQVMKTLASIEYAPYALHTTGLTLVRHAPGLWYADLKVEVVSVAPRTP